MIAQDHTVIIQADLESEQVVIASALAFQSPGDRVNTVLSAVLEAIDCDEFREMDLETQTKATCTALVEGVATILTAAQMRRDYDRSRKN